MQYAGISRQSVAVAVLSTLLLGTVVALPQAVAEQDIAASAAFLKEAGIIQGDDGTGDLRLRDQINRAELMKIVVAATTEEAIEGQYQNCFPDVQKEWFARYICWASQKGFIKGYPDGTFAAAKPVNTAEALKIVSEVLGLDFESVRAQADANVWFDVYVKNALRQGLLDTLPAGDALARPATRGQVFDYLFRAIQLQAKKEANLGSTFDAKSDYIAPYGSGSGGSTGTQDQLPAPVVDAPSRVPDELEEVMIQIMEAQLEQGAQDMSMSGSLKMNLELPLYEHSLLLDVDMEQQVKFAGDDWIADMQFTINAKGYSFANVGGVIVADTTMMADKDTLYLRINAVEASNLTANAPNAVFAFEATEEEAKGNAGKWFRISRAVAEAEVSPFIVLNQIKPYVPKLVQILERSMTTEVLPFVSINASTEDTSRLMLTLSRDRVMDLLRETFASVKSTVSVDVGGAAAAMTDLAENTELEVVYDKEDGRVRTVDGAVMTSFPSAKGRDFKIYVQFSKEFSYEDVTLDFPNEAIPLKFLPFVMKYRD